MAAEIAERAAAMRRPKGNPPAAAVAEAAVVVEAASLHLMDRMSEKSVAPIIAVRLTMVHSLIPLMTVVSRWNLCAAQDR